MSSNNNISRRVFLRRSATALGLVALLPVPSFGKPKKNKNYFEHTVLAMGTTARIGLYAKSERDAHRATNHAFAHIHRLERMMSAFDPESEISLINRANGKPVHVSDDVNTILLSAKEYAHRTDGAFDCTVEPFMQLWGFRDKKKFAPTEKEIASTLFHTGSHLLEVNEKEKIVTLHSDKTKIDLGGIAVGYALDRVVASLHDDGITSAFIDIGGDVYALGAPEGEENWLVEIPDPQNTARTISTINLRDQALATSGNYLSYVIYEAKKYGHIINVHEGKPSERILSSTVIAKRGIDVDALSTASFVSESLVAGFDAQFLFVDTNGNVRKV